MVHLTTALDPASAVPLYEQLYRSLAAEMRAGTLTAGTRMPGKRRLAAELSVSVNTVLLRGCWRRRATSFGCETTISSSRSITRDVSIRLSTTAEGAILVSVFAVRASGKNKVAASVILGLFIF